MPKQRTIGLIGGSFDPITVGHAYLIAEAARMVDVLHVVIGVNPAKKYLFSEIEREDLVAQVIQGMQLDTPVRLHFLKNELLIQLATKFGVTHLVRGIRSAEDFGYETQMALVNRKINPNIQTIYLTPPPEMTEVSSSTVKGLVGFTDWPQIVGRYVHPVVLAALTDKHAALAA